MYNRDQMEYINQTNTKQMLCIMSPVTVNIVQKVRANEEWKVT